jgi:histone deacetylase complex regulatory component SIN3
VIHLLRGIDRNTISNLYFGLCQVSDLLGKYPDLMDGFNDFLARCEKNGNSLN